MSYPETIRWSTDGRAIEIIDQRALPEREQRLQLHNAADVARAIRDMNIRGAPAIGVAAAMGVALELSSCTALPAAEFSASLTEAISLLASTRPTAVNLFWALERMRRCAETHADRTNGEVACKLYGEASAILDEDRAMCRAIGEHALTLFPDPATVLTHCNAGALATAGMGTALAAVYLAHERGQLVRVFSDETRPALQGSRLTAWELARAGIDVTVITDNVAGSLMRSGGIDLVIVGADRIAANGDVANKVGTYPLAVLANYHGIPFYVAAPSSTIDLATLTGASIPIEERSAEEVRRGFGSLTAPEEARVYSPAFDVTPNELITAIITERGILRAPIGRQLAAF
ncbi:MAG: S-methyl-5-thioribose-1-phosphate isomerase [Gemmatimonadota bacterium]